MKIIGLDHVGIAVEDIQRAVALYQEALGLQAGEVFEGGSGAMRGAFVPVGTGLSLELVQSLSPRSRTARLVAERGYGLAHVALRVEDLDGAVAELKARGIQFMDERPTPTQSGHRVIFVAPSSLGGLALELVGK